MKKIVLIHLVTIIYIMNVYSQSAGDSLQKSPTCFMIARYAPKATAKNVSEIYCIGDKIKVVLWDNRLIKGNIVSLSRDSMLTLDGTEIDFNLIRSITKPKIGTSSAIVGGLVVAAGAATMISLAAQGVSINTYGEESSMEGIPARLIIGAGLVVTGIVIITSNSKFKVESGDQMIFKD